MATAVVTPPTPSEVDSPTRPRLSPTHSVSFAEDLPRPRSVTIAATKEVSPSKSPIRRSSSFNRSRSASAPANPPPDGPLLNVPQAEASTTSLASTANSTISTVSSKRQAEFEKHFADELTSHAGGKVPEDYLEVIQTQSADLQVSVLLHGRLYLTRYHLCFRSNIIGIVTMKVHPLKDLLGLEKGTTAKWIQNAVYVWVDEGPGPGAALTPTPSPKKSSSRPPTPKESTTPSGPGGKYYGYGSMADRDAMYADLAEMWALRAPERSKAYHDSKNGAVVEDEDDGGSVNTATDAKIKHTECSGEHYKEVALDTKIAMGMKELYELLYENEEFHLKFLKENQKLTGELAEARLIDIKVNEWKDEGPGKKERTMTYVMHMNNPIGPSKSNCNGTETIVKYDLENAVEVMSETQTPDVPSGKSFKIHTRTCLTHTALDGKPATRIYATTQCDWSSGSLLKGTITPAVIKGQKEYHKQLMIAVKEWMKDHGKTTTSEEVKTEDAEEAEDEKDDVSPKDHHGHQTQIAFADKTLVDCVVEIWENPLMRWITVMCSISMALNWWYIFQ